WRRGDKELLFLPQADWHPHTTVDVATNVRGNDAGNGWRFGADLSYEMSIGAAQVSAVDATRHTMTVRSDGAVVRTLQVSVGKPETPTPRGSSVVTAKSSSKVL